MPHIYTLSDPRTGLVRYVVKSVEPKHRLRGHLTYARQGATDHKSRWIKSLLDENNRPVLTIIETCDEKNWPVCEKKWIAFYRAECAKSGTDLTNYLDGGGDGPVGKPWTEAMKRKRRRNWNRKPKHEIEAWKKKIGEIDQSFHQTEEYKQKLRDALKSPEVRAKISEASKRPRMPWTEERRANFYTTMAAKKAANTMME